MPLHEYSSASGGTLKLKGGSGVEKKKKKKKVKSSDPSEVQETSTEISKSESSRDSKPQESASKDRKSRERSVEPNDAELGLESLQDWKVKGGKTESERKYEETRRRRLEERLKRDGIKTHKERVEDLNRYLSNLSEHHDMPRIGPG